jgi:voltage-gated potassium channel
LLLGTVIVVGASFTLAFEHDQPGASINHFGDALWWAIVTCTTVGYGDHFPVTAGGQIIAVLLMILGIAALSVLTASIAALYVDQDEEPELAELRAQLDRIEQLLTEPAPT